jgi:hypothetical protein
MKYGISSFINYPTFCDFLVGHVGQPRKKTMWLEAWHCYTTLSWKEIYPGIGVITSDLQELLAL